MINQERISYLTESAVKRSASREELQELTDLLKHDEAGEVTSYIELLLNGYETTDRARAVPGALEIEAMADAVLQTDRVNELQIRKTKIIGMWRKVAVAASVLLVIGMSSYYLLFNKSGKQKEFVKTQDEKFKNDVNPGKYKAKLTLADGKTIVLDSAAVGQLTRQGGTNVLNKDGQLVYEAGEKGSGEVLYNTLSTARGETYATVLADGSKVWLNSASSIQFPVAFVGNERNVEITGEAYFEVAKNKTMPFKVTSGNQVVEVLGTHFNINAYQDEPSIKTTLLEGSVRVSQLTTHRSQILKPGQQATLREDIKVIDADTEEALAWKNGYFMFVDENIQSVMRKISRWYNVDIEYRGDVSGKAIGGIVSRYENVSEVLNILKLTGAIHFKIEGRRIVVMP